ncbi:26064_t:CDS:2, partial [Gigaspora margarita]
KACSESVQFISRATEMGKKRIGSTNKIERNRLLGSQAQVIVPEGRIIEVRQLMLELVGKEKISAHSSMVAIATACSNKLYSNVICKRVFQKSRTMEEHELAVPGSKSELVCKLLVRAQALSRKSVSNDWNRRLDKVWDIYKDYCGAAVSREHLEHHLTDPSKNYRVKRICKVLVKEYKKDKELRWPCNPLTVSALRQFVDKKPHYE